MTVTSAPTARVLVLSAPDICSEVRTWTTVVESGDEPRCVLAENLFHNVALTEVALNLLQREVLQFWDVVLVVRLVPAHVDHTIHPNLVS